MVGMVAIRKVGMPKNGIFMKNIFGNLKKLGEEGWLLLKAGLDAVFKMCQ